jgi:hypothetical protein
MPAGVFGVSAVDRGSIHSDDGNRWLRLALATHVARPPVTVAFENDQTLRWQQMVHRIAVQLLTIAKRFLAFGHPRRSDSNYARLIPRPGATYSSGDVTLSTVFPPLVVNSAG